MLSMKNFHTIEIIMLGMQSVASVCNEFIDLGIFWPRAIDRAKKTHANRPAKIFRGKSSASAMAQSGHYKKGLF